MLATSNAKPTGCLLQQCDLQRSKGGGALAAMLHTTEEHAHQVLQLSTSAAAEAMPGERNDITQLSRQFEACVFTHRNIVCSLHANIHNHALRKTRSIAFPHPRSQPDEAGSCCQSHNLPSTGQTGHQQGGAHASILSQGESTCLRSSDKLVHL